MAPRLLRRLDYAGGRIERVNVRSAILTVHAKLGFSDAMHGLGVGSPRGGPLSHMSVAHGARYGAGCGLGGFGRVMPRRAA